MTTPKNEKRSIQDSSRTGMANQNPSQQNQNQGDKSMQQGDTMDPNRRGGHRPFSGSGADLGKDPKQMDSTKRGGH